MKKLFLAIIICVCSLNIIAQQQRSLVFGGFGVTPYGQFAKNLGKNFGGIQLGYYKALGINPRLQVGFIAGASMYGYREYDVVLTPLNTKREPSNTAPTTGTTTVYEDDCVLQSRIAARYQLSKSSKVFTPYATIEAGWNGFFSHIDGLESTSAYKNTFQWQGHSAVIGSGLGCRVNLIGLLFNRWDKGIMMDAQYTLYNGSPVKYRNFAQDAAPKESLNYAVYKSNTVYTTFQLGMVFGF
jgi:hypothetical protein